MTPAPPVNDSTPSASRHLPRPCKRTASEPAAQGATVLRLRLRRPHRPPRLSRAGIPGSQGQAKHDDLVSASGLRVWTHPWTAPRPGPAKHLRQWSRRGPWSPGPFRWPPEASRSPTTVPGCPPPRAALMHARPHHTTPHQDPRPRSDTNWCPPPTRVSPSSLPLSALSPFFASPLSSNLGVCLFLLPSFAYIQGRPLVRFSSNQVPLLGFLVFSCFITNQRLLRPYTLRPSPSAYHH
jgi:hypothetical protein